MATTFYWSYTGMNHDISELNSLVSIELLEVNPERYLELLYIAKERGHLLQCLNDNTNYNVWYATHPTCLYYLVGDISDNMKTKLSRERNYVLYGEKNPGISQELAIEILRLQVKLGADLTLKNYYNKDILDLINDINENDTIYRINNDRFIQFVRTLYEEEQNN